MTFLNHDAELEIGEDLTQFTCENCGEGLTFESAPDADGDSYLEAHCACSFYQLWPSRYRVCVVPDTD